MTAYALRHRTRLFLAAVATLGAALSLTACQDEDTGAAGSSSTAGAESPAGQDEGQAAEGTDGAVAGEGTADDAGTGSTDSQGAGHSAQDAGSAQGTGTDAGTITYGTLEGSSETQDIPPCTDANTELTLTAVERPLNHMLLTVTNTGSETCFAWYGPYLRFGADAQAALPLVEASVPQAVVALDPGESAYAGILTSSATGEEEGDTVTGLSVQFADRNREGAGGETSVALPGGEVYVDNAAQVTYWQTTLDAALEW